MLQDNESIQAIAKKHGTCFPFLRWSEKTNDWVDVEHAWSVIRVERSTSFLLVRHKAVTPCLEFGSSLDQQQTARSAITMGDEDLAMDLAAEAHNAILQREWTPGTIWVVVWYNVSGLLCEQPHHANMMGKGRRVAGGPRDEGRLLRR